MIAGFSLARTPPNRDNPNAGGGRQKLINYEKFPWNPEGNTNIEKKDDLEIKRKQQEIFAETLRYQIEEKRKSRLQDNKEKGLNISQEAEKMLKHLQSINKADVTQPNPPNNAPALFPGNRIQRISYEPKPMNVEEFSIFRDSFVPAPMPQILVPNDSPFDDIKVTTPPLGFSMRKQIPVKSIPSAPSEPPETKYKPPRPKFGRRISKNPKVHNTFSTDDIDDIWSMPRLGTNSELVYPDGHISGLSSPR